MAQYAYIRVSTREQNVDRVQWQRITREIGADVLVLDIVIPPFIDVANNILPKKKKSDSDSRGCKILEDKMEVAAMIEAEGLTKGLIDKLIERIDVYGDNRVEIRWKFNVRS